MWVLSTTCTAFSRHRGAKSHGSSPKSTSGMSLVSEYRERMSASWSPVISGSAQESTIRSGVCRRASETASAALVAQSNRYGSSRRSREASLAVSASSSTSSTRLVIHSPRLQFLCTLITQGPYHRGGCESGAFVRRDSRQPRNAGRLAWRGLPLARGRVPVALNEVPAGEDAQRRPTGSNEHGGVFFEQVEHQVNPGVGRDLRQGRLHAAGYREA